MNEQQKQQLRILLQGGLIDSLLEEITKDIALDIVNTTPQQKDEREGLYLLSEAVKCLKEKLQEYDNTFIEN